jgi:hypothetical protein
MRFATNDPEIPQTYNMGNVCDSLLKHFYKKKEVARGPWLLNKKKFIDQMGCLPILLYDRVRGLGTFGFPG